MIATYVVFGRQVRAHWFKLWSLRAVVALCAAQVACISGIAAIRAGIAVTVTGVPEPVLGATLALIVPLILCGSAWLGGIAVGAELHGSARDMTLLSNADRLQVGLAQLIAVCGAAAVVAIAGVGSAAAVQWLVLSVQGDPLEVRGLLEALPGVVLVAVVATGLGLASAMITRSAGIGVLIVLTLLLVVPPVAFFVLGPPAQFWVSLMPLAASQAVVTPVQVELADMGIFMTTVLSRDVSFSVLAGWGVAGVVIALWSHQHHANSRVKLHRNISRTGNGSTRRLRDGTSVVSVFRSELYRLATNRLASIGLCMLVLAAPLLALSRSLSPDFDLPASTADSFDRNLATLTEMAVTLGAGVHVMSLLGVVVGGTLATRELARPVVDAALLATPRRIRLLLVKCVAVAIAVGIASALAASLAAAVTLALLPHRGYMSLGFSDWYVIRGLCSAVAVTALSALLACILGTLSRSFATTVAMMIIAFELLPVGAQLLFPSVIQTEWIWIYNIAQLIPNPSVAIDITNQWTTLPPVLDGGAWQVSAPQGLALLVIWAALGTVISTIVFAKRRT